MSKVSLTELYHSKYQYYFHYTSLLILLLLFQQERLTNSKDQNSNKLKH